MSPETERLEILAALGALWAQQPEQRLTQLIQNITRDERGGVLAPHRLWQVTDATLLRQIQEWPERVKQASERDRALVSNRTTLVQPCPECVAGKCPNCDGESWDQAADAPATCPCSRAGHPRRTT